MFIVKHLHFFSPQGILERSETETKQRLSSQIEKLEHEISHLKKKLENEVEQRHTLTRNLDVSISFWVCVIYRYCFLEMLLSLKHGFIKVLTDC